MVQVDDHARTQHTGHIRVEDAGGQQVQDELALLCDDGVPGIVAALIAGNDVRMFCQQVDDAALALIAPIDSSNSSQHNTSFTFFFPYHFTILLDFPLAISDCSAIIRAEEECVKRIFHMAAM